MNTKDLKKYDKQYLENAIALSNQLRSMDSEELMRIENIASALYDMVNVILSERVKGGLS